MVLEFVGAAHEVTGSCHYVAFGDKHVLVDCGMEQDGYLCQSGDTGQCGGDRLCVCNARTH